MRFNSLPIHHAFLAQLAEATRLERVQSRFESEGRYQFRVWRSGNVPSLELGVLRSIRSTLTTCVSSPIGRGRELKIRDSAGSNPA